MKPVLATDMSVKPVPFHSHVKCQREKTAIFVTETWTWQFAESGLRQEFGASEVWACVG